MFWGKKNIKQNFFITSKRGFIFNKVYHGQSLQTEEGLRKDICNVKN